MYLFCNSLKTLLFSVNNGLIIEPEKIAEPGVGFNPQGSKYVAKPEKEIQTFKLPEDLEVSLFAAEPMVVNPTCMNWDQKGRLWVACAPLYPHVKPGHRATDRIVVLEDTDGDGKADVSTTFAEDLLIPTAVLPVDGGVYVGNSTELLHLKDTDGDGKADQKRVVLSGFGTEDTHQPTRGAGSGLQPGQAAPSRQGLRDRDPALRCDPHPARRFVPGLRGDPVHPDRRLRLPDVQGIRPDG